MSFINSFILLFQGNVLSFRFFYTSTAINNTIYIFGGHGDSQTNTEILCSNIYYLDTTTIMWVHPIVYGHKPQSRPNHTACTYVKTIHFLENKIIYVTRLYFLTLFTIVHKGLLYIFSSY